LFHNVLFVIYICRDRRYLPKNAKKRKHEELAARRSKPYMDNSKKDNCWFIITDDSHTVMSC